VAPYAFNYHYDVGPNSASTFRGLAFANFRDPAETTAALAALNGYEIQGRRLRVEYKRVLRHGEKEKIEREKALKRMRSAVSMNGSGMPGGYSGHEDDFMHAMANQPPPNMSAYDSHVWASHPPPPTYQQPPPPAPIHSYAQQAPLSMGSPGSSDLGSGADPSSSSQSSSAQAAGSPIKADLDMNDPQTLESQSSISVQVLV
jgi:RNA recognition motif-containing protein